MRKWDCYGGLLLSCPMPLPCSLIPLSCPQCCRCPTSCSPSPTATSLPPLLSPQLLLPPEAVLGLSAGWMWPAGSKMPRSALNNSRRDSIMTIHYALHSHTDIARLHLPYRNGGKGLLQVKRTFKKKNVHWLIT